MTRARQPFYVVLGSAAIAAGALLSAYKARGADLLVPPLHTLAIGVTPLQDPPSPLPPGMRSIDVTMTRVRKREEHHRVFVRRLLSPAGPRGRLE